MEPSSTTNINTNTNNKKFAAISIVLLVAAAGYFLVGKYSGSGEKTTQEVNTEEDSQIAAKVVVEETKPLNGTVSLPAGFPSTIPMEEGSLLESATTKYLDQDAQQFSVSYKSAKTVEQKLAEYKDYMIKADYRITPVDNTSPVKSLFGIGNDSNLSVVISTSEGKTLVQLSYLVK